MNINRRMLLSLSGYSLAGGLASVKRAEAAQDMKALHLVTSLGKPSITWTTFDLLRPALQMELKGEVDVEIIAGHDGLDALHQVLGAAPDEPRLFGAALMAAQYAWRVTKSEVHLEDLMPIAKVTNGFSVTLFAKRGGALQSWTDLGAAKPLKLSSPQRHTAAYFAVLMMERKGGVTPEVTIRDTIGEVIDDVTAGRSALGVANTTLVSMKLGELQPIVSFGAGRNAMLAGTPTFAEAMGNPKLAFTESIGVLGSPKLDPDLTARLTQAFLAVGQDPEVLGRAEAANIPLAMNGPEFLTETMERNSRVLDRILG